MDTYEYEYDMYDTDTKDSIILRTVEYVVRVQKQNQAKPQSIAASRGRLTNLEAPECSCPMVNKSKWIRQRMSRFRRAQVKVGRERREPNGRWKVEAGKGN